VEITNIRSSPYTGVLEGGYSGGRLGEFGQKGTKIGWWIKEKGHTWGSNLLWEREVVPGLCKKEKKLPKGSEKWEMTGSNGRGLKETKRQRGKTYLG